MTPFNPILNRLTWSLFYMDKIRLALAQKFTEKNESVPEFCSISYHENHPFSQCTHFWFELFTMTSL